MIIGVLGKGGSGKSTVAAMLVRELHAQGNTVLAIDADHNMDLAYALAGRELPPPYLAESYGRIKELSHIPQGQHITHTTALPYEATLTPPDTFTATYSHPIADRLSVMLTGPQSEEVLHGTRCSHSLASSLQLYLPQLVLQESEYVVIDEKASADAASTGIPTGFDIAVIVIEPRSQSIRVGKHIAETLNFYGVPYLYVLNKAESDTSLPEDMPDIAVHIPLNTTPAIVPTIVAAARQSSVPNVSRRERTLAKYARARAEMPR